MSQNVYTPQFDVNENVYCAKDNKGMLYLLVINLRQ